MAPHSQRTLARSPLDSARFGLEIWRGHLTGEQVPGLWKDICQAGADIAIFRLPAEDIRAMSGYEGPREFLIHADTLVYYERSLRGTTATPISRGHDRYRLATADDDAELRALTARIFANYQNHYHANPLLPPEKILAGYVEWAAGHLVPGRSTRTWVALHDGAIVGFICCSFDEEARSAEIVLNGVRSEYAGQGIYADLVRLAQAYFADLGFEVIRVSTQVGNYAVQRVWAREGLRLSHAFDTWHVNATFSRDRH